MNAFDEEFEPNPSVYELHEGDLPALIRYQGADAVLDALVLVASEAYGNDAAEAKIAEFLSLATARAKGGA